MMRYKLYLESTALTGPGFSDLAELKAFSENKAAQLSDINIQPVLELPATERRRIPSSIKLALNTASKVFKNTHCKDMDLANIFASSQGDTDILHYLGTTLATKERFISPTKFHNSLHNAASGYWTIAAKTHYPSTAIAAGENTFAAGLIEAAMYCTFETKPILLVVYDLKTPPILKNYTMIEYDFAAAFILSPEQTNGSIARFNIEFIAENKTTIMSQLQLEQLRNANPAAKSLTLLNALANRSNEAIYFPYLKEQSLQVTCEIIL